MIQVFQLVNVVVNRVADGELRSKHRKAYESHVISQKSNVPKRSHKVERAPFGRCDLR